MVIAIVKVKELLNIPMVFTMVKVKELLNISMVVTYCSRKEPIYPDNVRGWTIYGKGLIYESIPYVLIVTVLP